MALYLPAGEGKTQGPALEAGLGDSFDMYVHNAVSAALDGVYTIEKVYRLSETEPVAPEPDQGLFGSTGDPEEIRALLSSAEKLLDGQETCFGPDTVLRPGTELCYYLDDTILVMTWQEVIQNIVYTFSEVKVAHPSQFKRFIAGNAFGSGVQYTTSDMAESVNAVAAINGDFYAFRDLGIVVWQGELYRWAGQYVDTCFFDRDRNMHLVKAGELTTEEETRRFVEENDILFSVSFGPILVAEGRANTVESYPLGEVTDRYARSAIGQIGTLHYLLAAANTDGACTNAPTVSEFALAMEDHGCTAAYTLDGGQTATIVINDRCVNPVQFGSERSISDILYFATAIPN